MRQIIICKKLRNFAYSLSLVDSCMEQGQKAHLPHAYADKLLCNKNLILPFIPSWKPNIAVKYVPLVLHIQWIPSSDLSLETSYPDWGFLVVFLLFHILCNSLMVLSFNAV
jgi:hypothetical protein